MDVLKLKKVTFTNDGLTIHRKKENIDVHRYYIRSATYEKWTWKNFIAFCLLVHIIGSYDEYAPGYLCVWYIKNGKEDRLFMRLKYKDALNLPKYWLDSLGLEVESAEPIEKRDE